MEIINLFTNPYLLIAQLVLVHKHFHNILRLFNTNKKLENQNLNFSRGALFRMKTRVSLKYFVNDGLWKQFFASNLAQTLSNVISLTILVTLRPVREF